MLIELEPGHLEVLSTLRELHAQAHGLSQDDPRLAAVNADIFRLSDSFVVSISSKVGDKIEPQVSHSWAPESVAIPCYPVYLDVEQLSRVKSLVDQASSREADPDSPIFRILDEVRAARRRSPLCYLPFHPHHTARS